MSPTHLPIVLGADFVSLNIAVAFCLEGSHFRFYFIARGGTAPPPRDSKSPILLLYERAEKSAGRKSTYRDIGGYLPGPHPGFFLFSRPGSHRNFPRSMVGVLLLRLPQRSDL